MGTKVVKELVYDAPPEEVAAMLNDAAFRERVLERMHVLRGHATSADGVVTVEQVQSTASLPSVATKIVGNEIRIVQVERWASTRADIEVSIPGKPGEMSGTAVLTPSGEGTVERVHMEITVRVPLVGGKLEGLVADMLVKALEKEHETGVDWLART
jgi:hypothetical protein